MWFDTSHMEYTLWVGGRQIGVAISEAEAKRKAKSLHKKFQRCVSIKYTQKDFYKTTVNK